MVPSARLELAQLSPLPPQDSVSTNFTTTAISFLFCLKSMAEKPAILTSKTNANHGAIEFPEEKKITWWEWCWLAMQGWQCWQAQAFPQAVASPLECCH